MLALWLEDRTLSLRRDLSPPRREGEALIRLRLSGICGTDLELTRGYYPFTGIIGHEFVGQVEEAPDPAWVGARVVGEINAACGHCAACRANMPTHCQNRTVLGILNRHGAHAQYLSLPLENLHRVPEAVPDEAAVFTEPLAAALEILQGTHIRPDERVLLVGAGRLGQMIARVLRLTGADLAVVARHPRQRDLLRPLGVRLLEAEAVPAGAWDVVVEATGSPGGLALATRALRPRGRLVLKSTYAGETQLNLSPWVVHEWTVIGSRCGPFAPALRLLETGLVDPRPLIEARYPLAEALAAMEHAARRGALKVLLEG